MTTFPALFLLLLAPTGPAIAQNEVPAGSVKAPEVDLAPKPLIAPDPWVPEVTGIAVCADTWRWALRRSFPEGRTYRENAVRRLEQAWQSARKSQIPPQEAKPETHR